MMNLIKFFHIVYTYINTHSNLTESKLIRNDSRFTFDIMSYFMLDVRIIYVTLQAVRVSPGPTKGLKEWQLSVGDFGSRFFFWFPIP